MGTHAGRLKKMEQIEVALCKIFQEIRKVEENKEWKPGQKGALYNKIADIDSELNRLKYWVG